MSSSSKIPRAGSAVVPGSEVRVFENAGAPVNGSGSHAIAGAGANAVSIGASPSPTLTFGTNLAVPSSLVPGAAVTFGGGTGVTGGPWTVSTVVGQVVTLSGNVTYSGAPTSFSWTNSVGTYGGEAEPGALLVDTTNLVEYMNTGTELLPVWSIVGAQGGVNVQTPAAGGVTLFLNPANLKQLNDITVHSGAGALVIQLPEAATVLGERARLLVTADSTGTYSVATVAKWVGGSAPTYSTVAGHQDYIELIAAAAGWIGVVSDVYVH